MASATPDLRLPSQPQSLPPNGRYQFILLGEQRRIVCEQLATSRLQVRRPNHYAATSHKLYIGILEIVWFVDWKVKGQGNGVNKCIFSHNITPMLTEQHTAWVWTHWVPLRPWHASRLDGPSWRPVWTARVSLQPSNGRQTAVRSGAEKCRPSGRPSGRPVMTARPDGSCVAAFSSYICVRVRPIG